QGRIRNKAGVHRHRGQRLCQLPRRAHEHRAHNRLAAVQDHRHAVGGQTGLWIVVRQFAGNGDTWTAGAIYLWGACLQQGNDRKNGYARTWASQTTNAAAGIACGVMVISAKENAESPLRVYGPGSNLSDHRLLEIKAGGELIL